ncbi:acyl-CoA dehydrogenase-like protein [Williamsia limnetica]|uniref:Acyl-CoA dehydrogenase-like protein n=1 Tax=Williamsia limnetica TaxID=882452 RepID=A0A318RLG2_WILLI|nr:acyl-CoA dehydrogenase family protein [Williamsia limnetica]PYE16375.1 acyl-CoA dehydrogenase-like protein [Williamsia limnetica]
MDDDELLLLTETFRRTMAGASGPALDAALVELGWTEMLGEIPEFAVPMAFRLLGETGAHASLINDLIGEDVPLPFAGGSWVLWHRNHSAATSVLDPELPLEVVESGGATALSPAALAACRRAIGWWLVGTSRTMLSLAREHALSRTQFGKPVAGFQSIRHKLAETFVAIEGAEATLQAATGAAGSSSDDGLSSLLAKAAAGQAALTASKHCQQILGGIGFTEEHDLQRHIKRAHVLDGLFGSTRELTREAGAIIRAQGSAPRLVDL